MSIVAPIHLQHRYSGYQKMNMHVCIYIYVYLNLFLDVISNDHIRTDSFAILVPKLPKHEYIYSPGDTTSRNSIHEWGWKVKVSQITKAKLRLQKLVS